MMMIMEDQEELQDDGNHLNNKISQGQENQGFLYMNRANLF